MKKGNQSTRGSLRWRISWNNSSGWLIDIFQFGTEQGGPVKRSPCIWYWWWKCYRSSMTNFALSIYRCLSSNNITSKDKQGLALCSPKGWQKFHSWTEEIRKYFQSISKEISFYQISNNFGNLSTTNFQSTAASAQCLPESRKRYFDGSPEKRFMKNQFHTFVSFFQTFWWPIPCQITRMVIFRGFLYLLFGFVSSWGWKKYIFWSNCFSSKNESGQIVSICIALVAHPWLSFQSDYAQNSISILKTTLFLLLSPGVANELLAWKSLTVIARIMFVINYYFW